MVKIPKYYPAHLRGRVRESVRAIQSVDSMAELIDQFACVCTSSISSGGKVLVFGNGGSAADAQHIAAELSGKFLLERDSYPAIALTTNSSVLTAIANDYSFEDVFKRQVAGLCGPYDTVIGISTCGTSKNVLQALDVAAGIGAITCLITSVKAPRGVDKKYDFVFRVNSTSTPRIQEAHILIGHLMCETVEYLLTQVVTDIV